MQPEAKCVLQNGLSSFFGYDTFNMSFLFCVAESISAVFNWIGGKVAAQSRVKAARGRVMISTSKYSHVMSFQGFWVGELFSGIYMVNKLRFNCRF